MPQPDEHIEPVGEPGDSGVNLGRRFAPEGRVAYVPGSHRRALVIALFKGTFRTTGHRTPMAAARGWMLESAGNEETGTESGLRSIIKRPDTLDTGRTFASPRS